MFLTLSLGEVERKKGWKYLLGASLNHVVDSLLLLLL